MRLPTSSLFFVLLSALLSGCHAEIYTLSNMMTDNPKIESFDKESGKKLDDRKLKLDVGAFGTLNATTDTCSVVGSKYRCDVNSAITADDGSSSSLRIQVNCPLDSQIAFNFRRANGCSCGAEVTSFPSGLKKFCPCIVCPMGFGDAPISVDCSMKNDPYIISTCTYMDCGFACNGTCEFNCRNSGPSCEFCSNNPNAPTPAPTGGNGNTPASLITSAAEPTSLISAVTLWLASGLYLFL